MDRRAYALPAIGLAASASLFGADRGLAIGMMGVGKGGTFLLQNALNLPGVRISYTCDINPNVPDQGLSTATRNDRKAFQTTGNCRRIPPAMLWGRRVEWKEIDI